MTVPSWFNDFARTVRREAGWDLPWKKVAGHIGIVESLSRLFEKWLLRAGCKCVFIDVWYSPEGMAASLAASRLGIPTIDFQHGTQHEHWAYAEWQRDTIEGYRLIPRFFWVWGKTTAESFRATNGLNSQALVGGNPWMNWWRNGNRPELARAIAEARALTKGFQTALLATTQHTVPIDPLLEFVHGSPRDWRWFVRLHRAMTDERHSVKARFQAVGHPGVNVDEAGQLPLYALFHAVDVHLTGYSTCATEALAFGRPTVLLDPYGREAFDSYVRQGVMVHASGPAQVVECVRAAKKIGSDHCIHTAAPEFGPQESSDHAINEILSRAEIGGCGTIQATYR
jgi:hypothetical protein